MRTISRRTAGLAALLLAGGAMIRARADSAALYDYGPAPEFASIDAWLNSGPLTMVGLRGKVVLVEFWARACINCLRTLPYVGRWHAAYAERGLVVVGVHTPEFAHERSSERLQIAMRRFDVTWPVAQDNNLATWKAFENAYWPTLYLIDRRGHVMLKHIGEGAYDETESAIRTLLAQPA
jgi:thiol-disulfide isomerase/thioredoxin